jgi:hypothetical protein
MTANRWQPGKCAKAVFTGSWFFLCTFGTAEPKASGNGFSLGEMMETIIEPQTWKIAEKIIPCYFPRLSAGIEINGKEMKFIQNNTENIYDIDWCVNWGDDQVAVIDTEYKPGWKSNPYPFWSVARYTMKFNQGLTPLRNETIKVRYYRQFPDCSFWMPIRSDYQYAGIITGRKIIDSPIIKRENARGMIPIIDVFEFPSSSLEFCAPFQPTIENYILQKLQEAGIYE